MLTSEPEGRTTVTRRSNMLLNSTAENLQLASSNSHVPSPSTPNFLFGSQNKRRSLALPPGHTYAGLGTSIRSQRDDGMNFASPLPPYINPLETSSKSVHWSPALVTMEKSPLKSQNMVVNETPGKSGPPLRSIREELDQMKAVPAYPAQVEAPDTSAMMDTSSLEEGESSKWVMVYGFAPADAAEVLKIFSRHGTIVAKKFPDEGNWVYLRYSCSIHAQQALSRNAHVFNGRLRLGVLPVKPEEVAAFGDCSLRDVSMRVDRENLNCSRTRSLHSSFLAPSSTAPGNVCASPLETSYRPSRLSNANRAGIRSLNASYSIADNEYRVDRVQQPLKTSGIMDKLWSYIS